MGLVRIADRLGKISLNLCGVQSRWIETSTARQHCFDAPGQGPGPTVVILHGVATGSTSFAPVIHALRREVRRVLAPEAPAHGFSEVPSKPLTPDLLYAGQQEMLDRLVDEPFVLFGNSLGGAVALRYALERPERLRGLILVSPGGAWMEEKELRLFLKSFELPSCRAASKFFGRLYAHPPWFSFLVGGDIRKILDRAPIRQFFASLRVRDQFKPEHLQSLSVPTLLIWGKADALQLRSNLEYFRRHLPATALIEEPEDFGHCPYLDRPKALSDRILTFVRTLGNP